MYTITQRVPIADTTFRNFKSHVKNGTITATATAILQLLPHYSSVVLACIAALVFLPVLRCERYDCLFHSTL